MKFTHNDAIHLAGLFKVGTVVNWKRAKRRAVRDQYMEGWGSVLDHHISSGQVILSVSNMNGGDPVFICFTQGDSLSHCDATYETEE